MSSQNNTIYVAIELSNSLWLVGARLPSVERSRMRRITSSDTVALLALISDLRSRHSGGNGSFT